MAGSCIGNGTSHISSFNRSLTDTVYTVRFVESDCLGLNNFLCSLMAFDCHLLILSHEHISFALL